MTAFDFLSRLATPQGVDTLNFALRLGAALICGSLIGVERQYRQRLAGLRTSALVASGSALFVLVSALTPDASSSTSIAAQVVSGVGFLCAGVIIRDGLNIRGLNTASTLWCASGVGVLAGSGFYLPALIGALVILVANLFLRPLVHRINAQPKEVVEGPVHYVLWAICSSQQESHVRSLILQAISTQALTLHALQSQDTNNLTKVEVRADLMRDSHKDELMEQIAARLSLEESVSAVRWEIASDEGSTGASFFESKRNHTEPEAITQE